MMKYKYIVRTVYQDRLESALNDMDGYEVMNIFETIENQSVRLPYFTIVFRRPMILPQTKNSRFKKIMMALDGRRARNSREG